MNFIAAWLMFLAILWSSLIAAWWFHRSYYRRMIGMGVDVVLEARRVADEFPDAYSAYRRGAEAALDDHAVGDLVKLLPETISPLDEYRGQ